MRAHHHHQYYHHHHPPPLHLKQLQPPHHSVTELEEEQKQRRRTYLDHQINSWKSRRIRKRSIEFSSMVPRDNNPRGLHEKLQILRSITHSTAVNESSIILDASKYIEELKEKVEILNQDITTVTAGCSSQGSSNTHDSLPTVTVETLEKGFLINVMSEKSCPGLLVPVLEAFEELNLNVSEATASCDDNFRLEAISSTNHGEEQGENVDAQIVRQAVLRAIRHWRRTTAEHEN